MPAAAFKAHVTANAVVSALATLEAAYLDPPPIGDQAVVEGLRGGMAVLLVAAFEQYVKEALSEALDSINTASPICTFSKLPPAMQVASVFSSLDLAMRGDYTSKGLNKIDRLPDVLAAVAHVHRRTIAGDAVAQTGGNPNSERVKSLYRSTGIPNVLASVKRSFDVAWGTPTASTFIPDTLNNIVLRRHVVAHSASALSITRLDLAEGQRFIACLVGVLDQALDRHIDRVVAKAQ